MPLVAGVGWTAHGYEVVVADDVDGRTVEAVEFAPDGVDRMVGYLLALAERSPLTCVVDTSNGLVHDWFAAAGLCLQRLDPQHVPQPYRGRRIPASVLAELGVRHGSALREIGLDGLLADRFTAERAAGTGRHAQHLAAFRVPTPSRQVFLTFDDGPSPFTDQVLAILAEHGARASFFALGLNLLADRTAARRITEAGHVLCNHTWSHAYAVDMAAEDWQFQIESTSGLITTSIDRTPTYFRPPYGTVTERSFAAASALGLTTLLWSHDSRDWMRPGVDAIVANSLRDVTPGSVILLHDGCGDRSQTVQALPAILTGLRDAGLEPAPLP